MTSKSERSKVQKVLPVSRRKLFYGHCPVDFWTSLSLRNECGAVYWQSNWTTTKAASMHMEDNRVKGAMKNPAHPGQVLKGLYLEPLELSITDTAKGLGVMRKTLSQLINGHHAVTPDMALRLAEAFNTAPQLWLNMQQNFDLPQAEKKEENYTVKHFWRSSGTELLSA